MQEYFSHQPGRSFTYPGPGAFAPESGQDRFQSAEAARRSLELERQERLHKQRLAEDEQRLIRRYRDSSAATAEDSVSRQEADELSYELDQLEKMPRYESMGRPHRFTAPTPKKESVPEETLEERRLRFKREMRLLAQNYAHANPDSRKFRYEVEGDLRAQRDREWMGYDQDALVPSREQISGRYPEQKPRREELEDRERLARWNAHLVENDLDDIEYDEDRELEAFLIERARERRRT